MSNTCENETSSILLQVRNWLWVGISVLFCAKLQSYRSNYFGDKTLLLLFSASFVAKRSDGEAKFVPLSSSG